MERYVWVTTNQGEVTGVWDKLDEAKAQEMDRCKRVTDALYNGVTMEWKSYSGSSAVDLIYSWEDKYGKHNSLWIYIERHRIK